jgi:hypothetical protein
MTCQTQKKDAKYLIHTQVLTGKNFDFFQTDFNIVKHQIRFISTA